MPGALCTFRNEKRIPRHKRFGVAVYVRQRHRPCEYRHHFVRWIALKFFLAGCAFPHTREN